MAELQETSTNEIFGFGDNIIKICGFNGEIICYLNKDDIFFFENKLVPSSQILALADLIHKKKMKKNTRKRKIQKIVSKQENKKIKKIYITKRTFT